MKRLAAVLLALIMLLAFFACDKTETSLPVPSKPISSVSSEESSLESSSKPSKEPSSSESTSSESTSTEESSEPDTETPPESIHINHYSFSALTDLQREYYERLHFAVTDMQSSWIVLGLAEENYKADIAVVRNALVADHPDIFWLPNFYATALAYSDDEKVAMMYFASDPDSPPSYTIGRGESERKTRELNRVVDRIVADVTATDPYEIELQLHDMLCLITDYSNDPTDPMIYTSYGALVNGKANCEGYSRAMQLLLSRFGIVSVTVSGIARNEAHMWNAVLLEDEWYHLDATWNDTVGDFISHEYFNLTDSMISVHHTFSKNFSELSPSLFEDSFPSFNINRPLCKGTINGFFARTGYNLDKNKIDEFIGYMVIIDSPVLEISIPDAAFRSTVSADPKAFIDSLNGRLFELYPTCGFKIDSITLSSAIARIYKTNLKSNP